MAALKKRGTNGCGIDCLQEGRNDLQLCSKKRSPTSQYMQVSEGTELASYHYLVLVLVTFAKEHCITLDKFYQKVLPALILNTELFLILLPGSHEKQRCIIHAAHRQSPGRRSMICVQLPQLGSRTFFRSSFMSRLQLLPVQPTRMQD